MIKRYTGIILGILLIGIIIFFIVGQAESSVDDTTDQTPQQHQKDDTEKSHNDTAPKNGKETSQNETSETAATLASISNLQNFFDEAVQRTIDFFAGQETNITAVGDSLTQGVGDHDVDGGYVGILDNTINETAQLASIDNYGKRGHRSDQLLKRLNKPEIEKSVEQASTVLITIGANDIMQVVKNNAVDLQISQFTSAKDTYESHLQQIFDKINDLNDETEIYLIGIYNPFSHYFPEINELGMIVDKWNDTSRTVAGEYDNATFIPIADLFKSGEQELFSDDNFHPSHQGYQLVAKRVLNYLID